MQAKLAGAALAAVMACAGLGASTERVEATPLLFKITSSDLTASFELDSNPTPLFSTFLFDFAVDNVSAVIDDTPTLLPSVTFFTDFAGGGFFAFDSAYNIALDLTGPQIFSGTIYDPYFSVGSFQVVEGFGPNTATLTISAVPLPASAPLFGAALLCLGVLGYGVKRRSQPHAT